MGITSKIGMYSAFLIAYALYYAITLYLLRMVQRADRVDRESAWPGYLVGLTHFTAFFVFIWLITLFFDLRLTVTFLVAAHLGMICAGLMALLVGSPGVPWRARGIFAFGEFGAQHPAFIKGFQWLGALIVVAYPVVIGFFCSATPCRRTRSPSMS
jgi:hypothetical protein